MAIFLFVIALYSTRPLDWRWLPRSVRNSTLARHFHSARHLRIAHWLAVPLILFSMLHVLPSKGSSEREWAQGSADAWQWLLAPIILLLGEHFYVWVTQAAIGCPVYGVEDYFGEVLVIKML